MRYAQDNNARCVFTAELPARKLVKT